MRFVVPPPPERAPHRALPPLRASAALESWARQVVARGVGSGSGLWAMEAVPLDEAGAVLFREGDAGDSTTSW